ncbi:MAG TPA: hypothetical protein VM580_32715 [Labilithrix sp.]|nr:hypothetical protein [Labilithrix sp.]
MSIISFAAGFLSGWLVRSTVESSRDLVVRLGVSAQEAARGFRRLVIAEREWFEDLWAEIESQTAETEEPPVTERPESRRREPANGGIGA